MDDPIRTVDRSLFAPTVDDFRRVEPDGRLASSRRAAEEGVKPLEPLPGDARKAPSLPARPPRTPRAQGPLSPGGPSLGAPAPQSVPELDEGRLLDIKV